MGGKDSNTAGARVPRTAHCPLPTAVYPLLEYMASPEGRSTQPMSVLIKNATIVTAETSWVGDIRCRGERIAELGEGLASEAGDEILDATGQLVIPGGIDPHVHMELEVAGTVSSDDFESGTAAALAGGTTTVIDFVHPERGEDLLAALAARRRAAARAVIDYGLHMAVTWWGEGTLEAMARCVRQEGIPSFKVYLAYKDSVGLEDRELIQVMDAARELEAILLVHAEHGDMIEHLRDRLAAGGRSHPRQHARSRPPETEAEATGRATMLGHFTGASIYFVHVTCCEAVDAIARARQQGWLVWGETCPQYLLLDDSAYDKPGFEGAAYVMAPPLRPPGHQAALWVALETGILQAVGTDHCPFTMAQKEAGRHDFRLIPGGAAGVQHRLSLLWTHGVKTGRLTAERFVDLVSTRPARLFGLYPRKGTIRVGADADLVVWNPSAADTIAAASHLHRCDRSIYEGMEISGLPTAVLAGGRIRYREGNLDVERGCGRFLARQASRR